MASIARSQIATLVGIAATADRLAFGANEPFVRVVVLQAEGSTPREAGAAMLVGASDTCETIGGGRLELEAIHHARAMLAERLATETWERDVRSFALGPSLGQCCGGHARLMFELLTYSEMDALAAGVSGNAATALAVRPVTAGAPISIVTSRKADVPGCPLPVLRAVRDMLSGARPRKAELIAAGRDAPAWFIEPVAAARTPLYIYGAGHVGRAIVHVLQGLPFDVFWVDTAQERFPEEVPPYARTIASPDPASLAAATAPGAMHLVLTYSHALDLAIVRALLKRADFAFLGLIGSATKATRFRKRLRETGVTDAALARLTCPIGLPGLAGKEPAVIAVSVAAQLLEVVQSCEQIVASPAEADDA